MAGLMRSWTDLELYTSCNILATNRLIEAAERAGSGGSSWRRRRRCTASRRSATRTARSSRRRGITKLAAEKLVLAHVALNGCRRRSSATSRSTGRASAGHGVPPVHRGDARPAAHHGLRRWRADTLEHVHRRRRQRHDPRARAGRGRRHLQHRRWADDLAQRCDRADRRTRRRRADLVEGARATGRSAPHERRRQSCPGRTRLRTAGGAVRMAWRARSLASRPAGAARRQDGPRRPTP